MTNPMTNPNPKAGPRGCTAHNRNGEPCGGTPIPGATVCHWHGGAAPQVQRSARLRLLEAVNPALDELFKIIADPDTRDADKLRALENIFDRAGVARSVEIDTGTAWELVRQRAIAAIVAQRQQVIAEQQQELGEVRGIVESDDGQSPENPP